LALNPKNLMNTVMNFSPLETFIILAINAWMFVVFPMIVIKKLNYMTALLESMYDNQNQQSEV